MLTESISREEVACGDHLFDCTRRSRHIYTGVCVCIQIHVCVCVEGLYPDDNDRAPDGERKVGFHLGESSSPRGDEKDEKDDFGATSSLPHSVRPV